MTASLTSTATTDKIVDAVASQATEIAKDVALPAAKFAAVRFVRTRARSIIAVMVVASAVAMLVKRKNSSDGVSEEAQKEQT